MRRRRGPRPAKQRSPREALIAAAAAARGEETKMDFSDFVNSHVGRIEPLERKLALAYWNAAVSGSADEYRRYADLRLELERIYSDPEAHRYVAAAREAGNFGDPHLQRAADLLDLRYRAHQADPGLLGRITALASRIENHFSVFRSRVDGRTLAANDVCRILRESGDGEGRRRAWEASKAVGRVVYGDMLELVRLRNRMAREAGFEDYRALSLEVGEQDAAMLDDLFDELDELTREPFREVKGGIDEALAEQCGVAPADLMPWHYHDPFFQDFPAFGDAALDDLLAGSDVAAVAARFYRGIGLPIDEIIARSDLCERDGKNQHAFCTDIDRCGDIRILCNVRDDFHWMETMLHECGHAVYDKHVDRELPYLLRTYPHLAMTEASAMFFGALARDPFWLREALDLEQARAESIAPSLRRSRRGARLVFARWAQVMYRFERELYRDPQRDLGALWWELVERYQHLRRPAGRDEPDWASKIHIVSSPVYYQNYMLGELIAAQLRGAIKAEFAGGGAGRGAGGETGGAASGGVYFGNTALGDFFRERVYRPGNVAPWMEHVGRICGEPLSARHFAAEVMEEQH